MSDGYMLLKEDGGVQVAAQTEVRVKCHSQLDMPYVDCHLP